MITDVSKRELDLIQYSNFDSLNNSKKSFREKQRNRQIAFKDTSALCRNIVRNNGLPRGRR